MEDGIAIRNAQLAFVYQSRHNEVTVQEIVHLQQGLSFQILVGYFQMHLVRLLGRVGIFHGLQLLLFLLQFHFAEVAHENGSADDAQHTQRIGTGVGRCYLGSVRAEDRAQCFVGSTETRRVRDGTIERAHHHGKRLVVAGIEEDEVAGKHHEDVQQDASSGQPVELDARLAETFKETGAHLQANHEDEQDEAEVLNEGQDRGGGRQADVSSYDSGKQDERNTQ